MVLSFSGAVVVMGWEYGSAHRVGGASTVCKERLQPTAELRVGEERRHCTAVGIGKPLHLVDAAVAVAGSAIYHVTITPPSPPRKYAEG